jgi:hypothetical protein
MTSRQRDLFHVVPAPGWAVIQNKLSTDVEFT